MLPCIASWAHLFSGVASSNWIFRKLTDLNLQFESSGFFHNNDVKKLSVKRPDFQIQYQHKNEAKLNLKNDSLRELKYTRK